MGEKLGSDEEKEKRKDDYNIYLKLMERDKKKFNAADLDADGKLNKIGKHILTTICQAESHFTIF